MMVCCLLVIAGWHSYACSIFPQYMQYLDWMNSHEQNFVCWPSVGPQDIKQKNKQYFHNTAVVGSTI